MNRFFFFAIAAFGFACHTATPSGQKPGDEQAQTTATAPSCDVINPLPEGNTAGVLCLNREAPGSHTIQFFRDSLLTQELFHSNITDWQPGESFANACPILFDKDHSILHFACVGKTAKAWQIKGADGSVAWVKKEPRHLMASWESYFLLSFGVRRMTDSQTGKQLDYQPLRKSPTDNADTLKIPSGLEMFCPIEVKGDWVRVTWDCHYNDPNPAYEGTNCHEFINSCNPPTTGWLRWRKDRQIIVDLFFSV